MSDTTPNALAPGPDGSPRCFWAVGGTPDYVGYHDDEWGRPVLADDTLFERLTLEAFQSGLSWLTILRKRESFRAAFSDFSIAAVADFGEADTERLLADAGIVRHRLKIAAAITNARAALPVIDQYGSLAAYLWRFRPEAHSAPRSRADFVAASPESAALAKDLKKRGFRFVGPTTAYSLMQAAGIVNDHIVDCAAFAGAAREQAAAAEALAGGRQSRRA